MIKTLVTFLNPIIDRAQAAAAPPPEAAAPPPQKVELPQISFVNTSLPAIVDLVINTLLTIAGTTAIIYFIYSGILYITAAGNPDAAKKGQQGLMYSAIGIAIIVLSRYIVTAVASYVHAPTG